MFFHDQIQDIFCRPIQNVNLTWYDCNVHDLHQHLNILWIIFIVVNRNSTLMAVSLQLHTLSQQFCEICLWCLLCNKVVFMWYTLCFFYQQRKPKKAVETPEDTGNLHERVKAMDIIALCCPKFKDRPQIARVIQRIKTGYSIHWMTGSYSGSWAEVKKREGRKKVPWVDTIKESDIIYKKISFASGQKLSNKVAQTLRDLYAAKDGD